MAAVPPTNLPVITREELARHDGKQGDKSVWMVVERKYVCDVTKFAALHPGGRDLVLEHAGKDGSTDFTETGHSDAAIKDVYTLAIGVLEGVPDQAPSAAKPKSGGFFSSFFG